MWCLNVCSSEDEVDVLLHGTPDQKRKLLRECLTGESESSSEDEFQKEMEAELNTTVRNIEGKWKSPEMGKSILTPACLWNWELSGFQLRSWCVLIAGEGGVLQWQWSTVWDLWKGLKMALQFRSNGYLGTLNAFVSSILRFLLLLFLNL